MKLFGKEKDECGVRFYFLGVKVYEERKLPHARKTYVFGIRVKKKTYVKKAEISPATLAMQQKIEWRTRLYAAEQRILSLGVFYKDMPKEQRYYLCFDALMSPYPEAIDAWTFFQYLQEKGLPSKYVLLKKNPLFAQLQQENRLKDVLAVDGEMQFLTEYPDIIAQSRAVLCSFGFDLCNIFKLLPISKYVFIEHGVTLINEWSANYYKADMFDARLIPTTKTRELYNRLGVDPSRLLDCGFPRWDKLQPAVKGKKERKIFVFFTMRASFAKDRRLRPSYLERIQSFINRLQADLEGRVDISLYFAAHHTLMLQDSRFSPKVIKNVNIIQPSDISSMIREADMCITDFSSISFDFLYRDVPTIYYCFDTDLVYSHMRDQTKLAADQIDRLLYNCCRDEEAALARVRYYIESDFELEPELKKVNANLFWAREGNCERLLRQIEAL